MASLVLYDAFLADLLNGVHNFGSHTFKFALSNTAPNRATHAVLADVTAISLTNLGGTHVVTIGTMSTTANVRSVPISAIDETASGSVGPYRYFIMYNNTASGDPLVGYIDRGSSFTLASTKHLIIDAGVALFTIS